MTSPHYHKKKFFFVFCEKVLVWVISEFVAVSLFLLTTMYLPVVVAPPPRLPTALTRVLLGTGSGNQNNATNNKVWLGASSFELQKKLVLKLAQTHLTSLSSSSSFLWNFEKVQGSRWQKKSYWIWQHYFQIILNMLFFNCVLIIWRLTFIKTKILKLMFWLELITGLLKFVQKVWAPACSKTLKNIQH